MPTIGKLLAVPELAERLSVSRATAYIGSLVRVSEEALARYLTARTVQP